MKNRNHAIIQAIVEKAAAECPGALAMIGIYGSCQTGDIHDKSDLDLMILINDPRGYCLAHTFIQGDAGIGHDLYCTTWEALEQDSAFRHPHISKLMDSQIVYCAEERYLSRLEDLRQRVRKTDTKEAAFAAFAKARQAFSGAILAQDMADIRFYAGCFLSDLFDSIALLNGRYYRLGVRRIFEELNTMPVKPENLQALSEEILAAQTADQMKSAMTTLLQTVQPFFATESPAAGMCPGALEEMFSNWRNKMYLAAETNNAYLAFNSLLGLDYMLKELGFRWNVMVHFHPGDLQASAKAFDSVLQQVNQEYEKAGIPLNHYPTLEAFLEAYKKESA